MNLNYWVLDHCMNTKPKQVIRRLSNLYRFSIFLDQFGATRRIRTDDLLITSGIESATQA
jgi:hypothetical protein